MAKVNGVKLAVMIDSGSSKDFIDLNVAARANFNKMITSDVFAVALANGSSLECNQIVPNCIIDLGNSKSRNKFLDRRDLHVLDLNNTFDIILGQPFLQSRNPIIDWRKRTLTFKKMHIVPAEPRNLIRTRSLAVRPLSKNVFYIV